MKSGSGPLVFVWQSLVVDAYRSFFTLLARQTPRCVALVAPAWSRELGGQRVECEPLSESSFRQSNHSRNLFMVLSALFFHAQIVLFLGLAKLLRSLKKTNPQNEIFTIVCIAEPYSITALQVWCSARLVFGGNFRFVCYTAQNIYKKFSPPLRLLQNFLFQRSVAILCCSTEQRDILKRQGYNGLCIDFPLWYNSSIFHCHDKNESRQMIDGYFPQKECRFEAEVVIGFCGNLTREKGLLDFLDALDDETFPWQPGTEVLIAGRGPLEAEVVARAKKLLQKGKKLHLLGPLPATAMPYFFSLLDLLVVPSQTHTHWKEQFGRVIIEARACGCLVAGSSSGAIPEVIGDNSLVFPERNAVAMRAVIVHALERLQRERENLLDSRSLTSASEDNVRYSDKRLAIEFLKNLDRIEQT